MTNLLHAACAATLAIGASACLVGADPPGACEGPGCALPTAEVDAGVDPNATGSRKDALLASLRRIMDGDATLFGQQRFNLTGIDPAGAQWLSPDGSLARSDARDVAGAHPAVLGIDVWDLAMKPRDWDPMRVHAAAARAVAAAGGVVTMDWHMRGCASEETSGTGFGMAGNETCLCRLANDADFARRWLIEGRLDRFADELVATGLDQVPIIFRPFHEMTGDWFWWGYPAWDCARLLPGATVTGPAAYQRVFRTVVEHLRGTRGLGNLIVAYAPDKLDRGIGATDEERYLAGYPGDDVVDVLGIDLYWLAGSDLAATSARYREYLATVTRLARARGKLAALTETGNYGLAGEVSPADSTWFVRHLLPLMRGDDRIRLAYALVWENRNRRPYEIYVPTREHPGAADFRAFVADPASLMLGEVADLYGAAR